MLIWGKSTMKLKRHYCVEEECDYCKHSELALHGVQEYGHIWFIPIYPWKKHFMLTCPECSNTISFQNIEKAIPTFKKDYPFKTPMLSWLGLIIVGLVIFRYSVILNLTGY